VTRSAARITRESDCTSATSGEPGVADVLPRYKRPDDRSRIRPVGEA
jgi:hypothetical protein